jgi:uncharacterized protein YigE (DUF2233 family)
MVLNEMMQKQPNGTENQRSRDGKKLRVVEWNTLYMNKLLIICVVALTLTNYASAVEFSSVEFVGKRFTVSRIHVRKERLQLFHRDDTGQPFKRFDRLASWLESRSQKLTFAMNAGMYHGDFSAVGLFVSNGRQAVSLNTANGEGNFFLKPNGVFAITESGARIIESSEYPRLHGHVILATQSGPLLVRGGKIHPAFDANSKSRFIRNGVGILSPDVALFVISEVPVNFYEFATLFRDGLHCQDALFLDGAVSSLYAPKLKRNDIRMDLGPIIATVE